MTKTILIVEDEPELAALLRDVLMYGGFNVVLSTGTAATAIATDVRPAAIVIDYAMPGLTGEQVIAQMRRTSDTLPPMILVTGRDEAAELAEELGVDAYLRKPFDVDELTAIVRSLTESREEAGH